MKLIGFEVGEDYVTVGAEKKAVTKYLNVPTMNLVDLRTKMIECSYRFFLSLFWNCQNKELLNIKPQQTEVNVCL